MAKKALFSFLLALSCMVTAAAAGTPQETIEKYYEYARWKQLDNYYSVIDTQSMSQSELAARKEITTILWQKMTPVEYSIEGMRVTEKDGFAMAHYTVKSKMVGHASAGELARSGGEPIAMTMPTAAILVKRADGWRVLTTNDPKRLNNTLSALMLVKQLRSADELIARSHEVKATGTGKAESKRADVQPDTPRKINTGSSPAPTSISEGTSSTSTLAGPVNIALHRPTLVSSISTYSSRKDVTKDGDGAVDGDHSRGMYGFHTNKEQSPWWQVDLGEGAVIQEIKVHNRASDAGRARTMRVLLSDDGKMWRQVHNQGGKSFSTLKVPLNRVSARYVRLQLSEKNWFHLDEVEVWGTRDKSESKRTTPAQVVKVSGESHWSSPEWKAKLDFWQSGSRMLSYYRTNNDIGWFWAEASGDRYEGWWSETASNEKCSTKKNGTYYWGKLNFSIKGEKLTGRWSYCDKTPTAAWTASKVASAHAFGVSPKWSLFDQAAVKSKQQSSGSKAQMVPGKMSPLSDDGRVRLEVIDPKEGFRLINEIIGYSLLPPFDNWRIAKPEPTGRIIIRDQGSCAMSFVPGNLVPGNPGTALTPRQLEKHWFQQMAQGADSISRSSFGPVTIAAYPAYFGTYDTNEGAVKTYFIKLPHTYLVAGFTCGKKGFDAQLAKFEKALTTIKALPGAKVAEAAAPESTSKSQNAPTSRPAETLTPDGKAKLFQEPGFGFTMTYPKNWSYEKPSSWTVVFSGPKGTDSYYTTVTIQNLSTQSYPDMDAVIADLKEQLKSSGKKHRWFSTLPFLYIGDAGNVLGKQFTLEYWEGKEKLRRTGILIPRPAEGIYHYWSYTAPEALYEEGHNGAKAMRDALELTAAK